MKSDRELLELAAKAAGVLGKYDDWWEMGEQHLVGIRGGFGGWGAWNPLTDDGDALRLAIKLAERDGGIALLLNSRFSSHGFAMVHTDANHVASQEYMTDEPVAATRRAIVRAAAAIGEAMP